MLAYDAIVAKRIGELLVEGGVLSQSQLEQALFAQRKDGRKLGQLLVDLGLVSEIQVTQTLSRQLSVPWVSLYHVDFSRSLLNLVPREISERYCAVPIFVRRIRKQGETLYVAMDDPTNDVAIQDLSRAAGLPVKPMIACPSDIRAAIRVYYLGEAPPPPPPPAPAPAPSAPRLGTAKEAAPAAPVTPGSAMRSSSPSIPPAPPSPPPRPSSPDPPVRNTADSVPDAEEKVVAPARARPRMIALTLLDGTTISLPAPKKRPTDEAETQARPRRGSSPAPGEAMSDQLTARDLVSAMRAVAHGADASEILGETPRWEAMFSALLSLMLRKGLIADWEFVEEFRKV